MCLLCVSVWEVLFSVVLCMVPIEVSDRGRLYCYILVFCFEIFHNLGGKHPDLISQVVSFAYFAGLYLAKSC